MTIGALCLMNRQHSNGVRTSGWTLAAWHWKWSITWRWVLSWHPRSKATHNRYKVTIHQGDGLLCGFNSGFGHLHFHSQPNMRRRKPDITCDSLVSKLCKQLGLPENTTDFSIHFRLDDIVVVKCEHYKNPLEIDNNYNLVRLFSEYCLAKMPKQKKRIVGCFHPDWTGPKSEAVQ